MSYLIVAAIFFSAGAAFGGWWSTRKSYGEQRVMPESSSNER